MEEQNQPLPCPIADESALMNKMEMRPPAHILNTLVHGYWSLTDIPTDKGWLEEPLAQWVDTVEILMNAHRGDPKLLIEANTDRFLIICNRTGIIIHETLSLNNDAWGEMPRVSFHEGAVTVSTVEWEDQPAPSIADELEAADLEGWN